MSSAFGARFKERSKGLVECFGQPFALVGYPGGVGSGTLGSVAGEFRCDVLATFVVSDAVASDDLADSDATMRTLLAVCDYVIKLHLDQVAAYRPPQQGDEFEAADGKVFGIDKALLPGNGWAYCGCSLG